MGNEKDARELINENLTDEEISLVKELIERGDEVEIRMVPADKKMLAKNVL